MSKVPPYCAMGMLTSSMLPMNLWLAPLVILGSFLGVFLLTRIPQRLFNVLALVLAGVGALRMVLATG
jgi:uncharacterized membrane protein YfcA